MDFSSIVISLLIAAYGYVEYNDREKAHRLLIERLTSGSPPSAEGPPPAWKLVTTGSVCILLTGFAAVLIYTGIRSHNTSGQMLEIMGLMMTLPLFILVLIFVRDVRARSTGDSGGKETER